MKSTNNLEYDNEAWIFSIEHKKIAPITKPEEAFYLHSEYIAFGKGHILKIYNNGNQNDCNYLNFLDAYPNQIISNIFFLLAIRALILQTASH